MSGDTVCCFVEPSNATSIHLQKSLGFIEKPTKSFNLLTVDGDIMFELTLDERFNVIPATAEEARFVMMFHAQNLEVLRCSTVPMTMFNRSGEIVQLARSKCSITCEIFIGWQSLLVSFLSW